MVEVVALVVEGGRLLERAVRAFEFREGRIVVHLDCREERDVGSLLGIRMDEQSFCWSQRDSRMVPIE